ncbi:hypothetical protein AB0B50_05660 [Streptomyces sp. NPDC041068]|uniref:hypothetical protein n=1 Tax=Streptomyces sp. NPDC041068 TaxID=3155130 RepID=UPI0033EE2BE7
MKGRAQKLTTAQNSARPEAIQEGVRPEGPGGDAKPKGIALYHDMRVEEDFTKCATRLFSILKQAAAASPGAPRYLFLDIQGHRNAAGGYDADALEIIGVEPSVGSTGRTDGAQEVWERFRAEPCRCRTPGRHRHRSGGTRTRHHRFGGGFQR